MTETYVLTGVTSGFGDAALRIILETAEQSVVVGARNPDAIQAVYGDRIKALPLDLASLETVRAFSAAIGSGPIAGLAMNAGMQTRTLAKTEDGFETTFQVNYLSHFLLFDLLKDRLSENTLVITTGSGTHDPEEKTPVPPPRHANVEWLAYPEKDPQPDRLTPIKLARAYSTSKLLCILMAMEIAQRFPDLRVASFDPGYLPDTKLAREYPALMAGLIKLIVPLVMKNDRSGSVATTAPQYARVLTGDLSPKENGGYIVMRSGKAMNAPPSELARQPGLASKVWEDSLALIGAA
ncbi:MAG: SDR family NAD(P)-dependent oxidoreductase [Pseudomonadota bacterium]